MKIGGSEVLPKETPYVGGENVSPEGTVAIINNENKALELFKTAKTAN